MKEIRRCTSNDYWVEKKNYWVEKKNAEKRVYNFLGITFIGIKGITFYEVSNDFEKN